jgi:hypothetical protein
MSLSFKEATESLAQAEEAHRHSAELYFYHRSSPHLMMWGGIWVVGYGGTYLISEYWPWLWGALILAGCIGGYLIDHRHADCASDRSGWRMAGAMAIAVTFAVCTYAIMWPVEGPQYTAFPALLTGAIHAAVGLWVGLRYFVTGVVVIALTLGGYYMIHGDLLLLWMAFVGGGSLILSGFWFRTV